MMGPSDLLAEAIKGMAPLNLGTIGSHADKLYPNLAILLAPDNRKEVAAQYPIGKKPWLMASNHWYPDWSQVLQGTYVAVDSVMESRKDCLMDLLTFIEMQFRMQVFQLAEEGRRKPEDYWLVQLKGEFLRETAVLGSGAMPGQNVFYIDAVYAFVRKDETWPTYSESTGAIGGARSEAEVCTSLAAPGK